MIAQNDRNKITQKVCKKRFFDFGQEKIGYGQKPSFLTKKWKFLKILVKIFFSESIRNVLKRNSNENLEIENFFPLQNFFLGLSRFSAKRPKIVKKWKSQKFFVETFFWSESNQNVLKRILNENLEIEKFFPLQNFFVGLSHFCPKWPK